MQNNHIVTQPARRQQTGRCHRSGDRVIVNHRAVLVMPRTGKPHPVLLHDLSTGGACVQTDAKLMPGDDVRLRIDVGLAADLVVDAIVIGVRPRPHRLYTEFGMRFIGLDPSARATLEAFVRLRVRP